MSHTPGPWHWEINLKFKQVMLINDRGMVVMDFARYGMQNACPLFRDEHDILDRCDRWATSIPGREHHYKWFQSINHPDAELIAAAPTLAADLAKEREIKLEMLSICEELLGCAVYWSEYDVPLGIVKRLEDIVARGKS